jgi:chemotaxis protein MotA
MDLAMIIGIVLAFAALFTSQILDGGHPSSLFLIAPLVLVIFGTFGAAMVGGIMKDTMAVPGTLIRAATAKVTPPNALVDSVVKLAERARREGLLALEDAAKEVDHPFLRRGLELAIDGTDPEELDEILQAEVGAKRKADKAASKIFENMGGYAPTVGILGTVMSMVHVMENLDKPETLGHSIAAAFLATLWGVASANLLWLPIAERLKRISGLECEQMELAIEGVLAIQAGSNPRLVAQKLKSLLPPDSKPAEGDKAKKAA